MKTVKRVDADSFENAIEDKETEGYKIASKTDRQAKLVKRNLGKAIWHVLIFLITVWFTFGLGNLAYLLFAYFVQADECIIKVKE